ncbi:hypothetical protein AV530_006569 [Patagioenas fasciata monilis]|uniref:Uncharacterized protein n=1 Tax=Patagioenas fasciata monilis TaxID=372326 RepID=A0A1V4KH89_PATFA|nr:hypothetical protein AV530_006569 [Patagioenas fasciata monilis]
MRRQILPRILEIVPVILLGQHRVNHTSVNADTIAKPVPTGYSHSARDMSCVGHYQKHLWHRRKSILLP